MGTSIVGGAFRFARRYFITASVPVFVGVIIYKDYTLTQTSKKPIKN